MMTIGELIGWWNEFRYKRRWTPRYPEGSVVICSELHHKFGNHIKKGDIGIVTEHYKWSSERRDTYHIRWMDAGKEDYRIYGGDASEVFTLCKNED